MWIFPWKVGSSPRQREGSHRPRGSPKSGHARLGELGDSGDGLSGSPRRACDCPRLVFVACLGSVSWPGF